MKLKIAFGLTFCCLLICLGMIVSNTSTAQSRNPVVSGWPFSVNFVEDPFRMHGLEVESYMVTVQAGPYKDVVTVPKNKKFIITDIFCKEAVSVFNINLGNASNPDILTWAFDNDHGYSIHLKSGLSCGPGDKVRIYANNATAVTISGYYVTL